MNLVAHWAKQKEYKEALQASLAEKLETLPEGKLALQDSLEVVWASLSRCLEEPQAVMIRI